MILGKLHAVHSRYSSKLDVVFAIDKPPNYEVKHVFKLIEHVHSIKSLNGKSISYVVII